MGEVVQNADNSRRDKTVSLGPANNIVGKRYVLLPLLLTKIRLSNWRSNQQMLLSTQVVNDRRMMEVDLQALYLPMRQWTANAVCPAVLRAVMRITIKRCLVGVSGCWQRRHWKSGKFGHERA